MRPTLYVGNKNYSSWSLRAGLCLAWSGLEYDEVLIDLGQPGYGRGEIEDVLAVSPTGRVPALATEDGALWDSLAIAEWVNELAGGRLWPGERAQRALARSATCEMHSGFPEIRGRLPMNLHGRKRGPEGIPELDAEIARTVSLWNELTQRSGGPWLFGERSIADAFFLPVVTRFRTYGVTLDGRAAEYSSTALSDPAFLAWEADSQADSWDRSAAEGLPRLDSIYPAR